MYEDICFPEKNEEEFIRAAERLEIKSLLMAYALGDNTKEIRKRIEKLQGSTKIKLNFGLLANEGDVYRAKNICDVVLVKNPESPQSLVENSKPGIIYDIEYVQKKDKTHYRSSNMNQVVCKLCAERDVIIGVSIESLASRPKEKRAIALGRISQNLRFCKKYGVHVIIASFASKPIGLKSPQDIKSLSRIL